MCVLYRAAASSSWARGRATLSRISAPRFAWYPLSMLPEPVMAYSALGVSLYLSGARYATLGW